MHRTLCPGFFILKKAFCDLKWEAMSGINLFRTRLPSGAVLMVDKNRAAPVVCVGVWVRAGSAYETAGLGGISHFIEHLFYRGTPRRPPARVTEEIQAIGGYNYASTWYDWTEYYSIVPAEHFDLALDGLSDGIRNMVFDEKNIRAEASVVIEEVTRRSDEPESWLFEEMTASLFKGHPYARPVVGTIESVASLAPGDFLAYHRAFYTPANLVISVSGSVNAEEVVRKVGRAFPPDGAHREPAGPVGKFGAFSGFSHRSFTRNNPQCYFYIGFRTPPFGHPDRLPLLLAGEILAGDHSSRLHRQGVEEMRIASVLSGGLFQLGEGGVFYVGGVPMEYEKLFEARAFALDQAVLLAEEGVTPAELEAAKRKLRRQFLFARERSADRASSAALAEIHGNIEYHTRFLERIEGVESGDLMRALRACIVRENLASVVLLPASLEKNILAAGRKADAGFGDTARRGAAPGAGPPDSSLVERIPAARVVHARQARVPRKGEEEFKLSNGVSVVFSEARGLPLVALQIFVRAGQVFEREGGAGLANLTLEGVFSGTERLSKRLVHESFSRMGDRLYFNSGKDYAQVSVLVERHDLEEAAGLLGEVIRSPAFEAREIEKLKNLNEAMLRERENNLATYAFDRAREIIYSGTPYRTPVRGTAESSALFAPGDLRSFHEELYGPGNVIISACGAVAKDRLTDVLEGAFGPLAGPAEGTEYPAVNPPGAFWDFAASSARVERRFNLPLKQAAALLAFPLPGLFFDNYAELMVLRSVLGMRVYKELIYGRSLAYEAGCRMEALKRLGIFGIWVVTGPENIEKGMDGIDTLAAGLADREPSAEEVERAKGYLLGSRKLEEESLESRARDAGVWRVLGERAFSWKELEGRVSRVDASDVGKVAVEVLGRSGAVVRVAPELPGLS